MIWRVVVLCFFCIFHRLFEPESQRAKNLSEKPIFTVKERDRWVKSLRIFLPESYVNAASGLAMVIKPILVTESLLGQVNEDEATLEMIRWFGVMVFAFGFAMLYRTLRNNHWSQN